MSATEGPWAKAAARVPIGAGAVGPMPTVSVSPAALLGLGPSVLSLKGYWAPGDLSFSPR